MKKNKKLILLIVIVILISINYKPQKMTVAPECFEHEDCKVTIPEGYCDIRYECYRGKCFSEFIRCPELCYTGIDEDYDGLISCDDSDCFSSIYCPCEKMSYTNCYIGRCYCPEGTLPHWIVEYESYCRCLYVI